MSINAKLCGGLAWACSQNLTQPLTRSPFSRTEGENRNNRSKKYCHQNNRLTLGKITSLTVKIYVGIGT